MAFYIKTFCLLSFAYVTLSRQHLEKRQIFRKKVKISNETWILMSSTCEIRLINCVFAHVWNFSEFQSKINDEIIRLD